MQKPIIVGFPLRGEWLSPNSPGTKIPSHGTNRLGTRYAYDFVQVNWDRKGLPAYRASLAQYLVFGVPLNKYYCWGQEIYAPCDGTIIQAEDGYKEQSRTNLWGDLSKAYKNARDFDPEKDEVQLLHICIFSLWIAVTYLLQTDCLVLLKNTEYSKMEIGARW